MITLINIAIFIVLVFVALLVYKLQTRHGFLETLNRSTGLKGYHLVIVIIIIIYIFSDTTDIEETKMDYYERGYDQGYSDGWDAGYENDDMGDHYDNTYPY